MKTVQLQMQKAILWEEACGKLRAMANVEGHRRLCDVSYSAEQLDECTARWERVNGAVEQFIEMMRSEGLCE